MKVIFRRNWFSPNGHRVRKSEHRDDWRWVDEQFRDKLPKTAKEYKSDEQHQERADRDFVPGQDNRRTPDLARATAEEEARIRNDVEAERLKRAEETRLAIQAEDQADADAEAKPAKGRK